MLNMATPFVVSLQKASEANSVQVGADDTVYYPVGITYSCSDTSSPSVGAYGHEAAQRMRHRPLTFFSRKYRPFLYHGKTPHRYGTATNQFC